MKHCSNGGPMKSFELAQVGLVDAQLGERVLDRAGNALARIGEGAVEVEEDVLVMHEVSVRPRKSGGKDTVQGRPREARIAERHVRAQSPALA